MDKSSNKPIDTMVVDSMAVRTVSAILKRQANADPVGSNNIGMFSKVVDEFGRTVFDYSGRWILTERPLSGQPPFVTPGLLTKNIAEVVELARNGTYFYIHDSVNVHSKPRTTALFLSPRVKLISSLDNIASELTLYFVSSRIYTELNGGDSFRQTLVSFIYDWSINLILNNSKEEEWWTIVDAIVAELDYVTLSLNNFVKKYRGLNVNFEPSVDAFGQIKIEVFVDESCVTNLSEGFTSENIELVTSRMSEISAWLGKSCNDRRVDPELFRAALEDFKSTEEKLLRLFTEGFMDNPS